MTFGLEFFDLTPTLRLSGDSIALVRKFTKVGGQASGAKGLEVGLTDDAELKLLESPVDGYITVADRDAAYTAIVGQGMVELVTGEFAIAPDAISRIQNISTTVLELGIAGSQPRLRFERKAVDGIQRVNDTLYHLNATTFDALVAAAATYQSSVRDKVNEIIAAYMASDAAIIDGVDFTGKITAPVEGNIVPFYFADQAAFPAAADAHGAVAHSHADGALFFAHGGMWHQLALEADLVTTIASVVAEATTREAADTALSGRLDVLESDPTTAAAVAAGDAATLSSANTYTDTSITNLVNGADAALDTLKEIGDALAQGDSDVTAALTAQITTEATTRANADTALSGRLDILEADPTTATAVAAVQADVDQNEVDADAAVAAEASARATADTALSGRLDVLEADPTTATALAAVQADVDQNETDSDAADAALSARLDVLEADPTTATAVAAVQADVDQNEADADAADAALSARLDVLEADPTTATAVAAVQADVDQNEADSDAAEAALSARLDVLEADPTTQTLLAAETAARIAGDTAANAYTDTQITNLIGAAPAVLNTLEEIANSINDDADVYTNIVSQIVAGDTAEATTRAAADTALSGRLDVLEADPTTATAVAAVQADVDQNEADGDAADAALSGRLDVLEADPTTATALAAVQADVDQNEADSDAAEAALSARLDVLEADPTTATALAAVQADVDQNETDGDAADAALSARLDTLEADPTTATAVAAVQADVDQNEADADAALALRALLDGTNIPGPYADDTAAASGGVAVGALYKHNNGQVHYRVS